MIFDFQEHKNKKEKSLLDIRAGVAVLQRTLQELNINKSTELNPVKKEIKTTIKALSKIINESTKNKTI